MQSSRSGASAVSFDDEPLILVDDNDRAVGFLHKRHCHIGNGHLHRAFSVFLFDRAGRVLLQQRSEQKTLWPMYWSNSCCSHPRRGERMQTAVVRRLREELGVDASPEFVYKFRYSANYGDIGTEKEWCWVYAAQIDGPLRPHPDEICAIRWLSPQQLDAETKNAPESFTPWSVMEWQQLRTEYVEVIESMGRSS